MLHDVPTNSRSFILQPHEVFLTTCKMVPLYVVHVLFHYHLPMSALVVHSSHRSSSRYGLHRSSQHRSCFLHYPHSQVAHVKSILNVRAMLSNPSTVSNINKLGRCYSTSQQTQGHPYCSPWRFLRRRARWCSCMLSTFYSITTFQCLL